MAKGLSAGMQFVLSAQSPTRQMLDGRIQNNIQSRIAFKVGSSIDSRIALGYGLAEDAHKLSKPGEAYFKLPTKKQIMRLQAPYVPDSELKEFSRAMNAQTA
jgi:DNA segregation ATPase FtsK/SpoIIIE, S-DNA-T family